MILFGDDITFERDDTGIELYGGARVYKKAGTGLMTRLHSANTRMQVETYAGTLLGTYWDSGNLPWDIGDGSTGTIGTDRNIRSTGYPAVAGLSGPGIEMHYNAATGGGARVLAFNRTTALRIKLQLDGSPIDFMISGSTRGWFSTAGRFGLLNLTPSTALVSNTERELISSSTTAAQIEYLNTLTGNAQDQFNSKPHVNDVNIGETLDSATFDPFADRFTNFNTRGGVRTMNAAGPFQGSKTWYNVVDVRHRNGGADGATGYGGELVWGMLSHQNRMAFRSRNADGSATSWTEVWTKAEISDANMPRLNGNNAWTGENTFYGDRKLRGTSFDFRSGSGGMGYGAGGIFAFEYSSGSEPYNGVGFWYSSTATRSTLGTHGSTDPANGITHGFSVYSSAEGSVPTVNALGFSKITFSTDLHFVTGANVTMTKGRAKIASLAARQVTLPSPDDHSLAIVMVETDATTGYHSVYPPSGSQIYWTDHTGTSQYTVPVGGGAGAILRVTLGMYWFVSDGTYWYAMSPART